MTTKLKGKSGKEYFFKTHVASDSKTGLLILKAPNGDMGYYYIEKFIDLNEQKNSSNLIRVLNKYSNVSKEICLIEESNLDDAYNDILHHFDSAQLN